MELEFNCLFPFTLLSSGIDIRQWAAQSLGEIKTVSSHLEEGVLNSALQNWRLGVLNLVLDG